MRMLQLSFVLVLVIVLFHYSQAGITDLGKDFHWKAAINHKLCQPGGHPDSVAKQFFACYQDDTIPGASKLAECQEEIYGAHLSSEESVGKACAGGREKFLLYADCFMNKLTSSGEQPSQTVHKLNICEGALLGVNEPA